MECSRVSELFSEYIDGLLDEHTRQRVEEHLAGCAGCAEELRELRSCVGLLHSLDTVRAPADFLDKVHERIDLVERISWWERVKKRFVRPWPVRIPLKVAGLAMATLLIVFIYHGAKQEKAPDHAPPQLPLPRVEERDRQSSKVPLEEQVLKETMPPPSAKAPAPGSAAAPTQAPTGSLASGKASLDSSTPSEPSVEAPPSDRAPAPAEEARAVRLVLQIGQTRGRRTNEAGKTEAPSSAGIARKPERMAAAPSRGSDTSVEESGASPPARRPEAAQPLPRVKPEDPMRALADIRSFVQAAGGSIDIVVLDNTTNQPESMTIRIPSRSFPALLDQLHRLGRLQGPAETWALPSGGEPLLVEVTLELAP